jgi:hypothetical protein
MGFRDLFRRRSPKRYSTPAEGDRLILEQLRELGGDLSRPRHVLQYLYFPTEAAALGAAETLRATGYDVDVRAPGEGMAQWGAIAEAHVVVDEAWVGEMRPRLDAIAAANGGDYDGWEAAAD